MYILNIASAIKMMTLNELREILYIKTIIKKFDLIKKIVIIQWNISKEKDLQSFVICNQINTKNTWSWQYQRILPILF